MTEPASKVKIADIELWLDADGTYAATWDGPVTDGATWDHPNLDSLFIELEWALAPDD